MRMSANKEENYNPPGVKHDRKAVGKIARWVELPIESDLLIGTRSDKEASLHPSRFINSANEMDGSPGSWTERRKR